MAGMTNSNFTGLTYPGNMVKGGGGANDAGLDIIKDLRDIACDGDMCWNYFKAFWTEGTYIEDQPGFDSSKLRLQLKPGKKLYPNKLYSIRLDRDENKIGT